MQGARFSVLLAIGLSGVEAFAAPAAPTRMVPASQAATAAGVVPAPHCPFGALQRGGDSKFALPVTKSLALPLAESALRDTRTGIAMAKHFGDTFHLPANNPSGNAVQMRTRAKDFAKDESEDNNTFHGPGGGLKINRETGEILISDAKGGVALFARLPVGERGVADFESAVEVFEHLVGKVVSGKPGEPLVMERRLATGKVLDGLSFPSAQSLEEHFAKHVSRGREFDARTAQEYEAQAVAFAQDPSPAAITISFRSHEVVDGHIAPAMAIKFHPLTGEMVIVNRDTKRVVTYYRYDPRPSNGQLANLGFPPAGNIFEFALALSAEGRPR